LPAREGTFLDPSDFGVNRGIENLPYLKTLGRQIIGGCWKSNASARNGLSAESIQRVVQPTVTQDGR
jgi:hypothetical protein